MTAYEWLKTVALSWNSDKCLIWPFQCDRDGYGRLRPPKADYGRTKVGAHRMIFKLKYGRWPVPNALHSCDNPRCCNLRHLSEGTTLENQRQMVMRGRSLRGTKQHSAKLTEVDIRKIRSLYIPNQYGGTKAIADHYGVTVRLIRLIAYRKLWRHVQ